MSAPFYVAQRQTGTTGEIATVYLQLTTSPFLAATNIFASTVSASYFRSDATGVSSIAILSTAAMGTYSSGNWRQVNSTLAPGWYEFGVPSEALSSGRWASLSIFSSSNIFSPQPLFYELTKTDNQTYVSSQTLSTAICRVYSDALVTTAAGVLSVGPVGVSSFNTGLQVGVSSFNSRVGVSSFGIDVGISSLNTGIQIGVSSITTGLSVGVSSFNSRVGVSSFNLPVGVSSFGLPVGVSSVQDKAGYGVSSSITVSSNVVQINGVTVIGSGTSGDLWRA